MARQRNEQSALTAESVCETWIQNMDFMLNRPYMPGKIPLFTYIYHEYIPLLGGDANIGLSDPESESMHHAANFVDGNQSFVMAGLPDYDFDVNPNYPIFTLLREIFRAQRTYARDYVVFGQMQKPPELKTANVKIDVWLQPGKETVDPPTADVPVVMSSAWRSPTGKTGYVLVNWTGAAQNVTLSLAKKQGRVLLVTAGDSREAPKAAVDLGLIVAAVPARSVMLVEQE